MPLGAAVRRDLHRRGTGGYRRGIDGAPEFVEVPAPTDEALQAVLQKIITRMMKLLTRYVFTGYRSASTDDPRPEALARLANALLPISPLVPRPPSLMPRPISVAVAPTG